MKYTHRLIIALGTSLISPLAQAHTQGLTTGLLAGLEHPLTGFDHLAALVLSGLLIGRLGTGKYRGLGWLVCMLGLGATGGMLLGTQAGIESLILLSLPVLFIFQWLRQPGQLKMAVTIMGGFMIAHGWAHGVEIDGAAPGFMTGFLLTSAMLAGLSAWISTTLRTSFSSTDNTVHQPSRGTVPSATR